MSSPSAATSARPCAEIGASGSSWISLPGTTGNGVVEQVDQGADEPGLGLAAQAEQDEVVLGQDRVDELRNHGVVVADDAGEEPLAASAA